MTFCNEILGFLPTLLFAWLLADFVTGIAHWVQDRLLFKPTKFKFLNDIKTDNDLHHSRPTAMLKHTAWQNINTSVPLALPAAALFFVLGAPTVFWLAAVLGAFANLIHRFAHTPRSKLNPVIRFLQDTGLFISGEHHNVHHFDENGVIKKEDTTVRYCPMTNWLNPVLDRIGFFGFLNWVFRV